MIARALFRWAFNRTSARATAEAKARTYAAAKARYDAAVAHNDRRGMGEAYRPLRDAMNAALAGEKR